MHIIHPVETTGGEVKQRQFLKWLKSQGVEATDAKRHIQLRYQGKVSHMPRHPGDEITTGLAEAIKKQLGLK